MSHQEGKRNGRRTHKTSAFNESLLKLEVVAWKILSNESLITDEFTDVAPQVLHVAGVQSRNESYELDVGKPWKKLAVEPRRDTLRAREQ